VTAPTCRKCCRPAPSAALQAHPDGCNCGACLAACWADFGSWESCEAAQAEMLRVARSLPPGALAAFDFLLRHGAEKHGCGVSETGGGQTAEDHAEHALDHLWRVMTWGPSIRDEETGRRDAEHAMVRLGLLVGLMAGRGE
jgi:hypothetical protein